MKSGEPSTHPSRKKKKAVKVVQDLSALEEMAPYLESADEPRQMVSPLRRFLPRLLPLRSAWLVWPGASKERSLAWGLAPDDDPLEWQGALSDEGLPDHEGLLRLLERAGADGILKVLLGEGFTGDPCLILVPATGSKVEDLEGPRLTLLTTLLRLTYRKMARNEVLSRGKTQWEKVFDASMDLFFFHDEEGRIFRANMAVSTFLGRPIRECIGSRCQVLFPGLCSHGEGGAREWTDPASRRVFASSEQIVNLEGFGATLHVLHEITQDRRLETLEKERHQVELTRKLLEGVAHEIRNPLFAISTVAQALAKKIEAGPDTDQYMEHILTQVNRLDQVIQRFMLLSSLGGRRTDKRLSLSNLLETALRRLREGAWGAEIERVTLRVEDQEAAHLCLGAAVSQAFVELIDNALSFSPAGSRVEAIIGRAGRHAVVSVADSGKAIPREHESTVFDPFYTTRSGHVGLGLAVAKATIIRHGGTLTFKGNAPSPGTTFLVTFPMELGPKG